MEVVGTEPSAASLRRTQAIASLFAVLVWLPGIAFMMGANALTRPHLGFTVHLLAIAAGLVSLVMVTGLGLLLRNGIVALIGFVGGVGIWLFADGSLVLINQYADAAPATLHIATIVSAEHLQVRPRSSYESHDATTDVEVSAPGLDGTIELDEPEYWTGTHPIGSKVRLYVRNGALGFAWLEKHEPGP